MVHLITGYAGEEHIQSADQGSFNASFFGTGQYVMEAGNQMEASITSNNNVRILDGDILMMGRHIRIPSNTYEDVNITTGTAGVNRNDLIVMEYSKDAGTGVETAQLKVIVGTETEGTATDPAYTSGDILAGDTLNQMPLYSVRIEGVVLADVVPLFETIPTYQALAERYAAEFRKACQTHLESLNILDTMEEVSANTQANQLAGALAVKELAVQTEEVVAQVSENLNVRYNEETDMVQIYFGGVWTDWKSANLQAAVLFDGEYQNNFSMTPYSYGCANIYSVASSNYDYAKLKTPNAQITDNILCCSMSNTTSYYLGTCFSNALTRGSFTKLYVVMDTSSVSNYNNNARVCIGVSNSISNGFSFVDYEMYSNLLPSNETVLEFDISNMNNTFYFAVAFGGVGTTSYSINIKEIYVK